MSKQFHPDVNPEGIDKFKEIAEAYDILGNEDKKQKYDIERKNPFGGMGGGFGDMFDLFNGFNPFNQQRRQQRSPDKVITINITPTESLLGLNKNISYQFKEMCQPCSGTGGDSDICITCRGNGVIPQRFEFAGHIHTQHHTCPTCQGQGRIVKNVCYSCSGNGFKMGFKSINVNIPQSVDNGNFLRIQSSGDYMKNTGYGDLVVQIQMINDGIYQKINNNLHMFIRIKPEELFLKNDILLEHPEGNIKIKFPMKLNTATPLRIKSKGYTFPDGKGDLIIKFDIDTSLSEINEEKENQIKKVLEKL